MCDTLGASLQRRLLRGGTAAYLSSTEESLKLATQVQSKACRQPMQGIGPVTPRWHPPTPQVFTYIGNVTNCTTHSNPKLECTDDKTSAKGLRTQASLLLAQLALGQDVYGMPQNWAPATSFLAIDSHLCNSVLPTMYGAEKAYEEYFAAAAKSADQTTALRDSIQAYKGQLESIDDTRAATIKDIGDLSATLATLQASRVTAYWELNAAAEDFTLAIEAKKKSVALLDSFGDVLGVIGAVAPLVASVTGLDVVTATLGAVSLAGSALNTPPKPTSPDEIKAWEAQNANIVKGVDYVGKSVDALYKVRHAAVVLTTKQCVGVKGGGGGKLGTGPLTPDFPWRVHAVVPGDRDRRKEGPR